MSMTLTSRYDVAASIWRVCSRSRWRVACPRRPGIRPSTARRPASSSDARTSVTARTLPSALAGLPGGDQLVGGGERRQVPDRVVEHGVGVVPRDPAHRVAGHDDLVAV